MARISLAAGALSAAVFSLGSCRAGGEDLEVVNNRLREENLTLRDQVAALGKQNAELRQSLQASAPEASELRPEVLANLPRVTEISLDRLTAIANTPNGPVLRAYVKPVDGRGRFVQLTGDVTVKLVRVPAGEGEDAETAAAATFTPDQVRDAYRSGFMGTHYTFDVSATLPVMADGDSLLVVATYEDGVTGEALKAERAVDPPS